MQPLLFGGTYTQNSFVTVYSYLVPVTGLHPKTVGKRQKGIPMKRMLGFILFWIAIGMSIMFFLDNSFLTLLIILFCLILGYNLFCN